MNTRIKSIWSVDDDEIFLMLTANYIKSINYVGDYKTFIDGHFALEELKKNLDKENLLPDLILLDINMPIVDAWEFIEEFISMKFPKSILIYIVTSSIDPEDRNKAKAYKQIQSLVEKPVNGEKLTEILNRHP